uniref:5'-nucleotidase n=1 Tax=Hirondellea gigas TaxID=1518452 RepID=A0A2P2I1C9_9CRUS
MWFRLHVPMVVLSGKIGQLNSLLPTDAAPLWNHLSAKSSLYATTNVPVFFSHRFFYTSRRRGTAFEGGNMSGTTNTNYPLLRKLGFPDKKNIRIKDPARTEEILQRLIDGGFKKLQVVADFDYTMTRVYNEDGERCHCSWGVLDNSPLMPEFYRSTTRTLLDKYYPIEVSPTMTEQEKIPHMMEWYTQVHELLVRCKLNRRTLTTAVANSNTKLRIGSEELLGKLEAASVPLLVFSAGMGDILLLVLKKFNLLSPNVKVVSNFFKYDQQDCVVGFEGEMIHMFNKNENAIHESPYFKDIGNRSNAILMGDSLGDIKMAQGIPSPNALLKIGFLNDKIDERLAAYESVYDVVLLDDQTMDVANAVVSLIH